MTLPIDRTAKAAIDTNLVNGVLSDGPKLKASDDVVYNTIDELYNFTTGLVGAGTLIPLKWYNVSSYYTSGLATTAVGSIASGAKVLTLTTTPDFVAGHGINLQGDKETSSLQVTAAATVSSNVTVTLNGVAYLVAVLSGDTIAQVATKIRAAVYAGWTAGGVALSDTITFTSLTTGVKTDAAYSAGTTTATGTMTTTTQGTADQISTVSSVSGLVVNIADNALRTITAGTISHWDGLAIQAAINAVPSGGGVVYFPNPTTQYNADNLQLKNNITLIGQNSGKNDTTSGLGIKGRGINPVFKTGIYPSGDGTQNRNISIYNLYVENTLVEAIQLYYANNFTMRDCTFKTTVGNAVKGRYSYRLRFENNFISTGGIGSDIENSFAMSMMDNTNGLVIEGNTITGGSSGSGVDIGSSQQIAVNHNIFESINTGYTVRIASNSNSYSGNVNGFQVNNNYVEIGSIPFVFGGYYIAVGGESKDNFINNTNIPIAGACCYALGRCIDVTISNNSYTKKGTEPFVKFYYYAGTVANYFLDGVIEKNYTSETTVNYAYDTTFSSTHQALGGYLFGSSRISFTSGIPTGTVKTQVTRTFTANVTVSSTAMIMKTTEGGILDKVELIDGQGSLGACKIDIGTVTAFSELIAGFDISAHTVDVYGYLDLGAIGNNGLIRRGEPVIINVTAGAGAGTFRLRLSYRN